MGLARLGHQVTVFTADYGRKMVAVAITSIRRDHRPPAAGALARGQCLVAARLLALRDFRYHHCTILSSLGLSWFGPHPKSTTFRTF